MISNRRMQFVNTLDGLDLYIYKPSLFNLYYEDGNKNDRPAHRSRITHLFHMWFYLLRGGYRILYLLDGEKIAAYLVYTQSGNSVVEGSTREDIYTIFITTYPAYRKKGYATLLVRELLHGIGLKYKVSYKTIDDDNIGSIRAAENNGYRSVCCSEKSRLLHRAIRVEKSIHHLYEFVPQ